MERIVLFAGGPLHGTTAVTDPAPGYYAADPPSPVALPFPLASSLPSPPPVVYHLSRFAVCGRIIWVGHLDDRPEEDALWDAMASDAAKAAAAPYVPAHP